MFGTEKLSERGLKIGKVLIMGATLLTTGVNMVLGIEEHNREQKKIEEKIASEARAQVQREWENMNGYNG